MMLSLNNVEKRYGKGVPVLAGVSMELGSAKMLGLFGSTGSGKSTLIRILAGIERADAGNVTLDGRDLVEVPPAQRRIAYIPQDFALYPHLSVAENIAHPLVMQKVERAERQRRVREIAERLGIEPLLTHKPKELSGGQKQRVALARGLVKEAQLYLLDDPLVGLDYKIRERLMEDLVVLQRRSSAAFLYATSNPLEAMAIADEICVLANGKMVDWAPSEELYNCPDSLWTRIHLGYPRTNVFDAKVYVDSGSLKCVCGELAIPMIKCGETSLVNSNDATGFMTVRPESVVFGEPTESSIFLGSGAIKVIQDIGDAKIIELETSLGVLTSFVERQKAIPHIDENTTVSLLSGDILVYSDSGKLIGKAGNHGR